MGVQEVDIVAMAAPITKYAVTVMEPADIRYHLEKAVHLARTGRPGPVWLDLPLDVQGATIDEPSLRGFDPGETIIAGLATARRSRRRREPRSICSTRRSVRSC